MGEERANEARVTALRLLVGRELTAAQLRERLSRRGFPPETIEATLDRLVSEHLVDDRRAALMRARQAATLRGRGPARVALELRRAGIAPDVVREAVAEIFEEVDRHALIERAIDRKLGTSPVRDRARTFRRLHAHLVRLGFAPEEVYAALRSRLGAPDSHA